MKLTDYYFFTPPENKHVKLWRYMDFTKFVSLLHTKSLFLCRSDLFDDPFEGTIPRVNSKVLREQFKENPNGIKLFKELTEFNRNWTYINCWHANEHESAAMWKIYTQTKESISIETDYESLRAVLPDDIYLGFIDYIDYQNDLAITNNIFTPFFYKRKSFAYEQELRAVFREYPESSNKQTLNINQKNNKAGASVPIKLENLIKSVRISPQAPSWFKPTVEATIKQFGFDFNVYQSSMDSAPLF